MKIQLTNSLLKRVSILINYNPLWAMLIVNEYLANDNPLRLAYKVKALENLKKIDYPEQVKNYIDEILSGACLVELPNDLKNYLTIKSSFKFNSNFTYKHDSQVLDRRMSVKGNSSYRKQYRKQASNS